MTKPKPKGAVTNLNNSFIDNELIFPTEKGTVIDPRNFNRHLKIQCRKANIKIINAHIFRHTFISLAVKNNVDPRILKRIVGHSDISITDAVYTHMKVDDLRDAMNSIK